MELNNQKSEKNLNVLDFRKLTNMPKASIKDTIQTTLTMEMPQKSEPKSYQTLTSWLEDSHVKHFLMQEKKEGLMTQEELSFLRLHGFSKTKDRDIFYSKMLKAYYGITMEKLSKQSLGFLPTWVIILNSRFITQKTMEFPKRERECFLRDILEESVDQKYYLTNNQMDKLLYTDIDDSFLKISETTKKGYKEANPFDGVLLDRLGRQVKRGVVHKESTGTLSTCINWGVVTKDLSVRKLTPMECERLQGFPDYYTKYGENNEIISNTQRYKCCGNAVTTNVVTSIVDKMFKEGNNNE